MGLARLIARVGWDERPTIPVGNSACWAGESIGERATGDAGAGPRVGCDQMTAREPESPRPAPTGAGAGGDNTSVRTGGRADARTGTRMRWPAGLTVTWCLSTKGRGTSTTFPCIRHTRHTLRPGRRPAYSPVTATATDCPDQERPSCRGQRSARLCASMVYGWTSPLAASTLRTR